jgi:tetratricopeptide (TPR) repeat protein
MELAKYEEVIDVIHDAITLSGHYPEYFYLQSAALFNTGKSREAISVLEHALTMDYSRHTILYEVCKEVAMRPEFQKVIGLYNAN